MPERAPENPELVALPAIHAQLQRRPASSPETICLVWGPNASWTMSSSEVCLIEQSLDYYDIHSSRLLPHGPSSTSRIFSTRRREAETKSGWSDYVGLRPGTEDSRAAFLHTGPARVRNTSTDIPIFKHRPQPLPGLRYLTVYALWLCACPTSLAVMCASRPSRALSSEWIAEVIENETRQWRTHTTPKWATWCGFPRRVKSKNAELIRDLGPDLGLVIYEESVLGPALADWTFLCTRCRTCRICSLDIGGSKLS